MKAVVTASNQDYSTGVHIVSYTLSSDSVLSESTRLFIIAQVYRLSAVHCQMTQYSQRVPGYLTRYSVSANEISFDKKISQ